jgi:hypothetical protein
MYAGFGPEEYYSVHPIVSGLCVTQGGKPGGDVRLAMCARSPFLSFFHFLSFSPSSCTVGRHKLLVAG